MNGKGTLFVWIVYILTFCLTTTTTTQSRPKCNLLLRKHNVYDGLGVIAGRDYKAGDIIESPPGVMVPLNYTSQTMLDFYASMHVDDFDNIVFGNVLMYNHHKTPSATFRSPHEVKTKRKGFAGSRLRFDLVAVRDIRNGSEIYVSYGTDKWFRSRNITQLTLNESDPSKYSALPGCTRATVKEYRGRLYSTQPIAAGEVLEVARALVLPAHRVLATDLLEYVWFKQDGSNVKGALLVLGNGALYGSPPSGQLHEANVNYTWFSEDIFFASNTQNYEEKLTEATAVHNIECKLSMAVLFRASRDILMNEELTVPIWDRPFGSDNSDPRKYRQTLDTMLDPKCVS